MYEYIYDAETGGIILTDTTSLVSKEPRPVYAQELDYLGVDDYLIYDKQQDVPYMWAEAARYIYKGEVIFNTKSGSLYEKPTLEFATREENGEKVRVIADGTKLETIDIEAMVEANKDSLAVIEQITVKKIYDVYKRKQKTLDCFHVAFSGGKDSIVLLDLVKKAIPRSSFMVVFGDTKMEFPDTYELVDKVEKQCKEEGINFYRATSHFEPEESWQLFGPPSRVLRWCCTVHKSAPQTLKIREVLGKKDYVGMDFVGVRSHESAIRATYDEENYGKKQKGQYSHHPILEWTSAEIWLYIFAHDLPINNTYKKGNSRAGCLFCPMATGRAPFFQHICYPKEVDKYINIVKETVDDRNMDSYVANGGFNSRRSGRDLVGNELKYFERDLGSKYSISIKNPSSSWFEWKKTISQNGFEYDEQIDKDGVSIIVDSEKNRLGLYKMLKKALKKAAYCVGCRVCEANCVNGAIKFIDGKIEINNCLHCGACHDLPNGCLRAESLKKPLGEKKMKSINCFDSHAPKSEWIEDFFNRSNEFLTDNSLGPNQIKAFKRFLNDASLINSKKHSATELAHKLARYGTESDLTWGIILIELAYNNPQFQWYINNMPIDVTFGRASLEEKLAEDGATKNDVNFVISAFKRICELPMGFIMNFGVCTTKGRQLDSAMRCKASIDDERVLLYSLYKYAEACEGYYQFSLNTLMNFDIDSVGISPVKIFGFEKDEMESMLRGLSAKYNDYIDADFTHDLDKITLRDYHTAQDVLDLF